MANWGAAFTLAAPVVLAAWIGLAAMYGLLKPVPSGCVMTYMYPTYIPIAATGNTSAVDRYGLYLYHEGWKKIDFEEHLRKLSGVPVLFIPGNGGSYKQVRSLAAESARAFQGGPLEPTFYNEAYFVDNGDGPLKLLEDFSFPKQYNRMLDWFAVDLEGEHSAMDGRILEEHTEYVVYAIHRILDQYDETREIQLKEGVDVSGSTPTSVILVGHSMGGFVARAVIVHPHLRKSSVETVITLSSPHQSPPVALQPSLGHYFSKVNTKWRKGYEMHIDNSGRWVSSPKLSSVVVVSISGGIHDYQVRTKLSSLDGVVPSSNGFMISSSSIKNVWLSMDHQSILWCNQLVIQIAHTLLVMINLETMPALPTHPRRLAVFARMLQSGLPQNLDWRRDMLQPQPSLLTSVQTYSSCPVSVQWADEGLEKDLYIQSLSVTILAMDGRRRWLDIRKLGSDGNTHFVFVTNLAPCTGTRLHLWPEKGPTFSGETAALRVLEVTSKMIHIPAGPAPMQIEPGSQTEQPAPSAFLLLTPEDMRGYRFLTISVAPRPTISGRPPPAASMGVGQFFNPKDGQFVFSPSSQMYSSNFEELHIKEDHPLAINISFAISLGFLPITLSLRTAGCGIKSSALPHDQAGNTEQSSLCKLRCFPPVALAWDATSGFHILPNIYSETITVDSLHSFWDSRRRSSRTIILLLVDPHCSYKISSSVSFTVSASRFVLSYPSELWDWGKDLCWSPVSARLCDCQIVGFLMTVIFFALMRQARAWELDVAAPSILSAVELNLREPLMFFLLFMLPLLTSFGSSFVKDTSHLPVGHLFFISLICYLIANGFAIILISSSKIVLYVVASVHTFSKQRWQDGGDNSLFILMHNLTGLLTNFYSSRVVRILGGNPSLVISFITIPLVCFIHPAVGLSVLILSEAWFCHRSLCSFLAASFRSHSKQESHDLGNNRKWSLPEKSHEKLQTIVDSPQLLPRDDSQLNSPSSGKSFGDTQKEIFNYQQGVLILHLVAALMFFPSLIAWLQRIGMSQKFPGLMDSVLCVGIIFHGLSGWKPDISSIGLSLPCIYGRDCGLSLVYLLSGYYSYFNALAFAPYRAFHAMAAIGAISFVARFLDRRRDNNGIYINNRRKHSHRH